jgi:hypothetical protein
MPASRLDREYEGQGEDSLEYPSDLDLGTCMQLVVSVMEGSGTRLRQVGAARGWNEQLCSNDED